MLFEKGQNNLIISKNKPPVAGAISWARSIFYRIKRPMLKFLTKEDELDKELFTGIKNEYKALAKMIDTYQKEEYNQWLAKVNEEAMKHLRKEILARKRDCDYEVTFSDKFKELIKEVKHLEKMGYKVPRTIVNISLQEKEYYNYIDQLHLMLKEYNEAVHTLKDIDRKLLYKQIAKLNKQLEPGHDSLNLSSLGIKEYIDTCKLAIKEFSVKRNKVEKVKNRLIFKKLSRVSHKLGFSKRDNR